MKFLDLENNAAQMKRKQDALREQAKAWQLRVNNLRRGSIRWTLDQVRRATGPLVYIWWENMNDKPLYIGQSRIGLNRVLDVEHHCAWARDKAKWIEFIVCETPEIAKQLEADLIILLKPKLNKVHPQRTD
jgi:hypothetical protein